MIDLKNLIRTEVDLKVLMDSCSGSYAFDIETDGLRDECTKMHCFGFTDLSSDLEPYVIIEPKLVKYFFENAKLVACHNINTFDLPVLEDLYDIKFDGTIVDTLALSYYLRCTQAEHGLAYYGEKYGIKKPEVEDWEGQTLDVYIHRVIEDVKITYTLARDQLAELREIYAAGGDLKRCLNFLNFKMDCLREQEENPLELNVDAIKSLIDRLEKLQEEAFINLKSVMPPNKIFDVRRKPKVFTKKDGSLSVAGERWVETLNDLGLPMDHDEPVKVLKGTEEPNPGSDDQIKDWLFSLGWEPCTYKKSKPKKGKGNNVPQVRSNGELTESIKRLMKSNPEVEYLEDLGVIIHRLGFLRGLLRDSFTEGKIRAYAAGFTNTLRLKHSNVVNVPGNDKKFGKEIRECFIAPEGKVVVGSDVSGLESATADHYMYKYDPDYVTEKRQPGFDAHTDIAVRAGMMTKEEEQFYKWYKAKHEL